MQYYSSEDMLGLVAELNVRRMKMVMGKLAQRQGRFGLGGRLGLSPNEEQLLVDARKMHHRFMKGDLTHTENDESRLRSCMDMLITTWAELNKQFPRLDYDWDARKLRSGNPLNKRKYRQAIRAVAQW